MKSKQIDELKSWIEKVIAAGNAAISDCEKKSSNDTTKWIERIQFHRFRSGGMAFLDATFGPRHPYYSEFDRAVEHPQLR